jgi:hypothetical protein
MHFIRNLIHDRVIEVLFFPTEDQVVDIFTKSLTECNVPFFLGSQNTVVVYTVSHKPLDR